MKRSHFIIVSQFNLPAKNNELTDEWMDHRLKLLEHSTLKSLSNQTDKNFLYLLICADDTPERYREALHRIMPGHSEIAWVSRDQMNYPGNNSELLAGTAGTKVIRPYIEPDSFGSVYTTHIGTDDVLARDYVHNTQSVYDWDRFDYHGFVSYTTGYVYLSRSKRFNLVDDYRYFFSTFREPVEKFQGAMFAAHSKLHAYAPVVRIPGTDPMWIKILHDNEIGTYAQWRRSFGKVTVGRDEGHGHILKRFDLDIVDISFNLEEDDNGA